MTFANALRKQSPYLLVFLVLFGLAYAEVLRGMVLAWYGDDNYSHGFLIPVVAGWFVYTGWQDLRDTEVRPSDLGGLLVLAGAAQFVLAWLATEYFNMRLSMVVLLAGAVLLFFGREVFRKLRLPIGYLVLMVPLPYILYDAVAFPLKLFVAKVSVKTLQLMNFAVFREGNVISFPNITLEVADACSGLRSIMSLIALAVTLAFIMLRSPYKRLLLILLAVPFAVFTNTLRVIATGVLARYFGRQAAEGFFHEFAGIAVFVMALVLLLASGFILKRMEKRHDV
ncbi:exosortase A [Salidesulfovibrio brasiliensis]|uniref:exosortase A n=1 Tax=Salidesulfovibrio brasiliensis TaxID=221711 RepID=UPI0006D1F022|nr:exosortase A [Salidesulfovibrio brasiliensis]